MYPHQGEEVEWFAFHCWLWQYQAVVYLRNLLGEVWSVNCCSVNKTLSKIQTPPASLAVFLHKICCRLPDANPIYFVWLLNKKVHQWHEGWNGTDRMAWGIYKSAAKHNKQTKNKSQFNAENLSKKQTLLELPHPLSFCNQMRWRETKILPPALRKANVTMW